VLLNMHIVIATVGTRGDAQPYVALGKVLVARGHRVTLATHEDHRELAESNRLAFRPVGGSFRTLMESPSGRRWLESGANVRRYLKALHETFAPVATQWLAEFDAAIADADAVLVHSACLSAACAVHSRGLPCVVISPYPTLPSGELPIGLPEIPLVTSWLNRVLFGVALDQLWRVGAKAMVQHRARHSVAEPRSALWRELVKHGVPHIHLFSEHVIPRPKDWPTCAEVTGYCFLDAPTMWQPPPQLREFLEATPKPIYIGFGSMTGLQPEVLAEITREALRLSKQRAVIGMGWGGIQGIEAAKDLFLVEDVPHEWLFPRVAAVVHHCGAGTSAAALRAGRPSVAVPFFADQPTWARVLHALGTGPAPVPKAKLTAARLAAAITEAVSDPRHAARAADIGAAIRAESGASRAADRIEHHLQGACCQAQAAPR
jgi:sterol 3beta-glucosyltransferase